MQDEMKGAVAPAAEKDAVETVRVSWAAPGIRLLTLHAPRRRNALSEPVRIALHAELEQAMQEDSVKAIILTGGEGIFCAGGDIGGMGQPLEVMMERLLLLHPSVKLLLRGPKPVIAAVDGPAFGAGWSLALACDWIVATPAAKFSAAFARVGLVPDCGMLWTLPRRIGERKAAQYFIRANAISAPEALDQGIIDEITVGDLIAAAVARVADLTATAPLSLAEVKAYYADASLDAALAAEGEAQRRAFQTADHAEAVAAFREKRPARYEGR